MQLINNSKPNTRIAKTRIARCVATACLGGGFAIGVAAAPSGADVVHGNAVFNQQGNTLQITNSDGTIINWQDFSIANGEQVQFLQNHVSSAILNRVVSNIPSDILGELTSNGRVFVINPNGLVIGNNASIDTAGFVASTLDIKDNDFLAGTMKFVGDSGKIENHGYIAVAPGGEVVLIAPDVENHGIIEAENGEILLAAGREVVLHSAQRGGLSYKVSAPGDRALNIGQLVAKNGSVKVFADQIFQQGSISVTRSRRDAQGNIVLEAQDSIDISGSISAEGEVGQSGGNIHLLGEQVQVSQASVNASGAAGGGEVLIGGDQQGQGTVQRARTTTIDSGSAIRADGGNQGDGGRVIVFSTDNTRIDGTLSAQGGSLSGDGGFIETSGLRGFAITAAPQIGASNGRGGQWLIDPFNISIVGGYGASESIEGDLPGEAFPIEDNAQIYADFIASVLTDGDVTITTTNPQGQQQGNISILADIISEGDNALILQADNDIAVNATVNIGGDIILQADNDIIVRDSLISQTGNIMLAADVGGNGVGLVDIGNATSYSSLAITAGSYAGNSPAFITITGAGLNIISADYEPQRFGANVVINAGAINFGTSSSALSGDIDITTNTNSQFDISRGQFLGGINILANQLNVNTDGNLAINFSILRATNFGINVGGTLAFDNGGIYTLGLIAVSQYETGNVYANGNELAGSMIVTNDFISNNGFISGVQSNFTTRFIVNGSATLMGSDSFATALTLESVQWINNGDINWQSGDIGISGFDALTTSIENNGVFRVNAENASLRPAGGDEGVVIEVPTSSVTTANGIAMVEESIARFDNAAGGTLIKGANTGSTLFEVELENNGGTITVENGATLDLGEGRLTQTSGQTILAGGVISRNSQQGETGQGESGTVDIEFSGGSVSGQGTIEANVSAANTLFEPGFSPGILTIDGDFNAANAMGGANNTFNFEIDDINAPAGVGFDQLVITGSANIDASNSVNLDISELMPSADPAQVALISAGSGMIADLSTTIIDDNNSGTEINSAPTPEMTEFVVDLSPGQLISDPVDPPTDPVDPPTDPVDPPTDPVDPPTDPIDPPADPVDPPTDPVDPPTDPVDPPTDPVDPPTDPVDSPVTMPDPPSPPAPEEPEVVVVVIDGEPQALLPEIVAVLVSLDEDERRAYLESEQVRERLQAVNMCLAG